MADPKLKEFLEDFRRREYEKRLDKYRRQWEEREKRRMMAPTQEAAQGGRIGYQEGTETVQPTYGVEEHFSADMKQNLIEKLKKANPGATLSELVTMLNERYGLAQGGRIGFQAGGIQEQRMLQPEYIEALGKTYAGELTRQAGIPAITTADTQQPGETAAQFAQRQAEAQQFGIRKAGMAELMPTVAGQDPLQAAAYAQATDTDFGLGAYKPHLTTAGGLTGPMTAQQRTDYMSPYQQDVIDKTLDEFDVQAGKGLTSLGAAAIGVGGYGGGRHGVAEAEYQSMSDRNRALLQAQMLGQGFQQAQQARQQDYTNVMNLAQQTPALVGQQIAGLGTLGGGQQAYQQSLLDASRTGAQMAVYEPQQRLGTLGSGITGLMGGTAGFGTQIGTQPQSSPLASALGIGATLAGIYGMAR